MAYETIRVNIFETTAELWLDGWRAQETKPMYAAMIPGSDRYYCFAETLEYLPKELALVTGVYNKVIARNLDKAEYFKNMKFGDSEQAVSVYHKPLSPSQLEDFVSAAILEIGHLREHLCRSNENEKHSEEKKEA